MKPVRRLWLAQIVSVFGDFLAIFAVLSYASFNLQATATQVTLISVSFMLPFAFIGPVAGVFVDRWNVKRTMIASDLIRAGLALALVFTGTLGQIYAILFLLSVVSTFFVPAQTVTLRTIVPREGLLAANSLIQQAFQIMRIVSPALAGAMVAWLARVVLLLGKFELCLFGGDDCDADNSRQPVVPAKGSHPNQVDLRGFDGRIEVHRHSPDDLVRDHADGCRDVCDILLRAVDCGLCSR